jgi:general secretion pathway protein H
MTRSGPRKAQSGVTLIEMMIVLAVIGVATGAATLGLGALARDDATERAARQMAAVIGGAVDEALISGVSQGLVWDGAGYQTGTGARRTLPPAVTLAREDGSGDAVVLAGDATSPPMAFVLQGSGGQWRVVFDGLSAVATAGPAP